jgi:hypothetical protein|uniref:hypothetical protein n=1 Tax=Citrobacter freundii TaxID=546 RepID=UPI0020171775|nr:hypothetical protein [Citrobacter freundii]
MAGSVNDQNQLASVVSHRDELTLQAGGSKLMKSGHVGILRADVDIAMQRVAAGVIVAGRGEEIRLPID